MTDTKPEEREAVDEPREGECKHLAPADDCWVCADEATRINYRQALINVDAMKARAEKAEAERDAARAESARLAEALRKIAGDPRLAQYRADDATETARAALARLKGPTE